MSDTITRYLTGRPLDAYQASAGHYPYLTRGSGRLAGWQRQLLRLVVPASLIAAAIYPRVAVAVAVVGAWLLHRRWTRRRFHRAYIGPTSAALRPVLGGATMRLHVDPSLGTLVARLAKPLSPAETRLRTWYGVHVEPPLRYLPNRCWRVMAAVRGRLGESRLVKAVRRPRREGHGPKVELVANTPFLTSDQRSLVSAIISAKIPAGETVERWEQVGPKVTARWTVRRRPPAKVGLAEVQAAMPGLQEWEFFLGLGSDGAPVKVSLRDDSPHIAVSAGSGAGKSVLAQLVAAQVLHRGGQVVILDRKGSHRWALNLPGVDYCTRPAQMHDALPRLAALADERNTLALHEADDWDPGPRILLIAEELNATIGQLSGHWADVRDKSDPKRSPAISGLADLLFMGRSAKINVLAVAQMLSARAIGGPECRENFGVRCLARYTTNAWKMLVPAAAMPRPARTLGRWQVVVGDRATETQVAFLTANQVRALSRPPGAEKGLDTPLTRDETGYDSKPVTDPASMTLNEAIDAGIVPWRKSAARVRLHRARKDGRPAPTPIGRRGMQTHVFDPADLAAWVESETGS
jgi:Helicase HerA, central domain